MSPNVLCVWAESAHVVSHARILLLQKAKVLYDAIEASDGFYSSPVDPGATTFVIVASRK